LQTTILVIYLNRISTEFIPIAFGTKFKVQSKMKELTKAEEQVMQLLWKQGKAFVKDLMEVMPEPKPAYNTVSTIVRILRKEGICGA
jgi:N-glycosylase/DNA lyase